MSGSLIIVGLGMLFESHLTLETISTLNRAETICFLANDTSVRHRFQEQYPQATDLSSYYDSERNRTETYDAIVEHILSEVRAGQRVCVAFYGHPGVFVSPAHKAIKRARIEGFSAIMLPGISAQACMLADLGIDPAIHGLQTYEATDFLVRSRHIDISSGLMLWQVGAVGNLKPPGNNIDTGFTILKRKLSTIYAQDHELFLYTAATNLQSNAVAHYLPLAQLQIDMLNASTTMYIPPQNEAPIDSEIAKELNLDVK